MIQSLKRSVNFLKENVILKRVSFHFLGKKLYLEKILFSPRYDKMPKGKRTHCNFLERLRNYDRKIRFFLFRRVNYP